MNFRNPFKKKKLNTSFVEPDEIFLDTKNLPNFDRQQFEGRIEKPITKQTLHMVRIFFLVVLFLFGSRLVSMQIVNGESYFKQSQANRLDHEPLFAERGIIYDRNQVPLAWNEASTNGEPFFKRVYKTPGYGHLLGYIGYPEKDAAGFYWQSEFFGKDGVEKKYNEILQGVNGMRLIERDVHGTVSYGNQIEKPIPGENLTLAIDSRIQDQFADAIKRVMDTSGYIGGAAMVMDIHTGELITAVSLPEYDSTILSVGEDKAIISGYFQNKGKPFLNRTVSGVYTPGSIVKPFMAMAALTEGVVTPQTRITSRGYISIPNPYAPGNETRFKDYREDNGIVDLRRALAVSSNIYFYNVVGGYKTQRGIGITNVEKYARLFGIGELSGVDIDGEKTGTIPSIAWKAKVFPGDTWRIGDTYNTAIGQYGFQVTPIEMLRAIASIANNGTLVTPHTRKDDLILNEKKTVLPFKPEYFQVIREGMRLVVTDPDGTARQFDSLPFAIAAKTGTAEVGASDQFINSWAIGFFPYENPRYAFTVAMERGSSVYSPGAQSVLMQALRWIGENAPEYTK